jgi:hypothetical protein
MTKLLPGRASFPHWLGGAGAKTSGEINLSKPDRKSIVEKVAAGTTHEEALGELLAEKLAAKLARMKPDVAERYLRNLMREPSYTKHARNFKHYVRWLAVHQLHEMCPDKSLDSIYAEVAKTTKPRVDQETIRSSYELVERARKVGRTSQFFYGDGPPLTGEKS